MPEEGGELELPGKRQPRPMMAIGGSGEEMGGGGGGETGEGEEGEEEEDDMAGKWRRRVQWR